LYALERVHAPQIVLLDAGGDQGRMLLSSVWLKPLGLARKPPAGLEQDARDQKEDWDPQTVAVKPAPSIAEAKAPSTVAAAAPSRA
jgi:hypothetical protein